MKHLKPIFIFLSSLYFPFFVIALVSKFNTGYGIQMS